MIEENKKKCHQLSVDVCVTLRDDMCSPIMRFLLLMVKERQIKKETRMVKGKASNALPPQRKRKEQKTSLLSRVEMTLFDPTKQPRAWKKDRVVAMW